jgi:hypothetical protein
MRDPLPPVLESLNSLFHLETTRNGRYAYPEVQQLKDSSEEYSLNPSKDNFVALKKALRKSLNYIEKWQLDFTLIKNSLDSEAQFHGMKPINWPKLVSNSKASSTFKFSALNHAANEEELLNWIAVKAGVPYDQINPMKLTQILIDNKHENGFSKKLSEHLRKEPDFLFHLIMKSEKSFVKVASTLLILYLTDEQLAKAIIKHTPDPTYPHEVTHEQVSSQIDRLNQILSYGRSISTLLRNANAKAILDLSSVFQLHQSDEYAHRELCSPEHMMNHIVHARKHVF